VIRKISDILNFDYKDKFVGFVRGFPADPTKQFVDLFRLRPNQATLQFLHHKLNTFDFNDTKDACKR
jgi:hypothetical protein